ncbi:MAG TPA: glycosyltransferase 87 family protein [Mycobacteriales bacterium]|nr:glycosyltransferase 87 family protein [Mycobacteriales bacterium]
MPSRHPGQPASRLPAARVVFVAAALVALALSFPILWHQIYADPTNRLVDLEVYREAGRSVLDSRAVYEFRTPEPQDLPFTYPPFAAVLSVPLALVHFMVAGWIWELASLVVLIGLVAFLYRPVVEWWRDWLSTRYGDRAATLTAAALAPLLLPALIWLEPVRTTFRFGQVNIFMIALVVADCCLPRTRWPRGVLVGLATAIKLTPGLFVPYLWLTGRRRAAYVATATFVAAQGLAMVVIPGDSVDYWTDAFFSSGRLGNNRGTANIAIRGALMRWWLPGVILAAVLLVIAGGVLVVGMSRAVRASQAGAEVAGVTIVGLITVAISPVSWDHHAVWVVGALALLVADPTRTRRLLAAVLLAGWFYTRIPWWTSKPARLTDWPLRIIFRLTNQSFTWLVVALVLTVPLVVLARRAPDDGARLSPDHQPVVH